MGKPSKRKLRWRSKQANWKLVEQKYSKLSTNVALGIDIRFDEQPIKFHMADRLGMVITGGLETNETALVKRLPVVEGEVLDRNYQEGDEFDAFEVLHRRTMQKFIQGANAALDAMFLNPIKTVDSEAHEVKDDKLINDLVGSLSQMEVVRKRCS